MSELALIGDLCSESCFTSTLIKKKKTIELLLIRYETSALLILFYLNYYKGSTALLFGQWWLPPENIQTEQLEDLQNSKSTPTLPSFAQRGQIFQKWFQIKNLLQVALLQNTHQLTC